MLEQLSLCKDYLVCEEHKTSSTYGCLSKWLAPGTVDAVSCYLSLPRAHESVQFLLPARAATTKASVPKYLDKFCSVFLPEGCVRPTTTLLRKWYHTKLQALFGVGRCSQARTHPRPFALSRTALTNCLRTN